MSETEKVAICHYASVAHGLVLSIKQDGNYIRVHLEDPMEMTEASVSAEVNSTTLASREYHLREAVVIAMRQLIAQAFEVGMMKIDLKKLPMAPAKHHILIRELPEVLEEDIY